MRVKTRGLPGDCHKGKKVYTRGLSWPPSGLLTPGDAFDAGRADVRRLLRPPHRAASHHHSLLTPLLAAAMAAPETAALRAASRRDPSGQRPWQASVAASAWPSLCHASPQPGAAGGVSSR